MSVKKTGDNLYNDKCKGCHSKASRSLCTEQPDILAENGNNCISCHMPRSGTTDIPHVTVHDHMIRIPIDEKTVESVREFVGINCINNPDVDQLTRGRAFIAYFEKFNFQTYALDSAEIYIQDHTPELVRQNFHELIHIGYLRRDHERVIGYCKDIGDPSRLLNRRTYDNKAAWTAYRIAESYNGTGDAQNALRYFEIAYKLAPSYPDFAGKYGNSLVASGQLDDAAKVFRASLDEYPKHAPNWNNLGFTELLRSGDTSLAATCYNNCLSLDPDNFQALLNKSALQALMGEMSKARVTARKAQRIDPTDEDLKRLIHHLENK